MSKIIHTADPNMLISADSNKLFAYSSANISKLSTVPQITMIIK